MGSLLPPEGTKPRYSQLYVHDPTIEVDDRISQFSSAEKKLRREIVQALQDMLDEHNVLARSFCQVRCSLQNPGNKQLKLRILGSRIPNGRQYELPTETELAGLIPAELPDPLIDPVGYAAATKFMVHGPCGQNSPNSSCMVDNRCKKFFPKPYAAKTTIDAHDYAIYKRRMTGITTTKSGPDRSAVIAGAAGPDEAASSADISPPIDEITQYLDCRSISSYEAIWTLFSFQIHESEPNVIRLCVHMLDQQPVSFDAAQPIHSIVARPSVMNTMLTQWFTLNAGYPSSRNLTYDQIPNSFVWSDQCKDWCPRKSGFAIGRIPSVPAAFGDVFYLRILLGKILGALSFKHLRIVRGVVYEDYQQACQAMGLLANDNEWDSVMQEVSDPAKLLKSWWESMSEDFTYRRQQLDNTPLPQPPSITSYNQIRSQAKIVLVVASAGIAATLLPDGVTAHSSFKIPLEVDNLSTCMVKKGTEIAELLKEATLIVWDEAPMVHRLSFEAVDRTMCNLMNKSLSGPNYTPFGGKTVLLGGDFRQTLPVVPNGSREANVNASLPHSYLWKYCTLLQLSVNMHITGQSINNCPIFSGLTFTEWVLAMGNGTLPSTANQSSAVPDWITIQSRFLTQSGDNPIGNLIARVYPSFKESYQSLAYIKARAIVTPTNVVVSEVNNLLVNQLPGASKKYFSADSISTTRSDAASLQIEYPLEFLNSLSFNGVPEHSLELKPYVTVMLLRNINPAAGMYNGTRVLLTHLGDYVLRGLIVGRNMEGTVVAIPRIVLDVTDTK
ncbi:hypothetical protein LINPERPRIM_LOCUS25744 [Linum perenne]